MAFLEAGPPPVYIGFGSMPSKDPENMAAMVTQAL
jgi:sterol 3beta-glucosyltransferase